MCAWFFSINNESATPQVENATSTVIVATTTEEMATNSTSTTPSSQQAGSGVKETIIPGYPNTWPSDVPKYPVPVVKYTGGNNPQSGPNEATIVFTTKDPVRTVVNFYINGLQANGWKITENGNGLANQITVRATKNKRGAGVYVERTADGKTTVTVGVNIGI